MTAKIAIGPRVSPEVTAFLKTRDNQNAFIEQQIRNSNESQYWQRDQLQQDAPVPVTDY